MIRQSARLKATRAAGKRGEEIIRHLLKVQGYVGIYRIHTPWKIIRNAQGKATAGDRIIWSDLDAHQIAALDAHDQQGGISLLGVVIGDKAALHSWPIPGFGPRKAVGLAGVIA